MPKINSKNTYYDLADRFEDAYGNVYDPTNLDLKLWLKANDTVATVGGFPVTRNAAEIELNQHISKKQYPAFRKTGASSSLSIADAKDLYFPSTGSFTLSMWIYHPPGWTGSSHGLIAKGTAGLDEHEWEVYFVHNINNGYIALRVWDESQTASVYRIATNLNSGQAQDASSPGWKHWVFTDHSTNTGASSLNDAKIYLNGAVLSSTAGTTGTFVESEDLDGTLKIGLGISIANTGAETKFAEIAIWKSELSLTQIKAIYNATKEGVIKGYEQSGFTTQSPRVALQINDTIEDNTYVSKNASLVSRNIVGRNFRNPKFDDSQTANQVSGKRCETILLSQGRLLIDAMKFYIRGADGLTLKTFAISSSSGDGWLTNGGLSATDVKVDVTPYVDALTPQERNDDAAIDLMVAQALGDAIAKEKSLKLDVHVEYNAVYLKDQHVEKITVDSFGDIKPPRAIHHPRVKLKVDDGDETLNTSGQFAERQILTLFDAMGVSRKYVLVDANATSVTTGTILQVGSDYGSGTLSGGDAAVGGVAVAVNLTGGSISTQNALLVQLKAAIEHPNGHNGKILVQKVPNQASGIQTIDIMSALPPQNEGSDFSYVDALGGSQFTVVSDPLAFHKIGRPLSTITVAEGSSTSSLPQERDSITITTGDGTTRKYVVVIGSSTTVLTGEILTATSDTGSGVAGAANAGGIAVRLGSNQVSFLQQLKKAITSLNGHGRKIKIPFVNSSGQDFAQSIHLTDMTSGDYVPEVGSPVRSVVETEDVNSTTVTNWQKVHVTGGKIVETILGTNNNYAVVQVLSPHGLSPEMTHGANYTQDSLTKNILVGHYTFPDLKSSVSPSAGSEYNTLLPLISSGSSRPFVEEGLFAAFGGEPGDGVDIDFSYATQKGIGISRQKEIGRGFQADISSKECITIEIDGASASSLTLYHAGQGSPTDQYSNMAYINPKTGQWTALKSDLASDTSFPGGTSTFFKESEITPAFNRQVSERSHIGFGQGTRNLFRMISAPNDKNGSFVLGSFGMSPESLELEKERYAFIEASHNPCINSFGFPSHPKYCAKNDLSIDMSKYIDSDFLVESIAVEAKAVFAEPQVSGNTLLDPSYSYAIRRASFGEIVPTGCTFFLLNQRKSFLPESISQNTFHIETDLSGTTNIKSSNIQRDMLSIPGWYPTGFRQNWTRGTAPASVIYNGGAASTVNDADHANSTGWSFKGLNASLLNVNANFSVNNSRLELKDNAFITTSTTEDTVWQDDNTARENAPPYYLPIGEGYSTSSYLTTSEAYRLRLFGKKHWSGSNTKASFCFVYIYATYLDDLLANRPEGVRNLVGKYKISEIDEVHDIPIRSVFDGKGRKFNLHISIQLDGTWGDNWLSLRAMEIYRVETSSYVESIRDVIGWGSVGQFPTEFSDRVAGNLASKAKDPRDSYSLVFVDDTQKERNFVVSFPPKAPSFGDYGTLATTGSSPHVETTQIITNWDSMGRSGVTGVPSDRSVISGQSPGVESLYMSRQYFSHWEVPQPKTSGIVSPYLLKKSDRLILGVQSLTDYQMPASTTVAKTVTLQPSRVKLKIYGSRVSNGEGSYAQTSDSLTSNAVHETIGAEPVRDQFETEPAYYYEGTYLDNIIAGDPSLTVNMRGGELVELGIPRSYPGDVIGFSAGTFDVAKIKPFGLGRYGDFDAFLPTWQSVASPGGTMNPNEYFYLKDQNGLARWYQSNANADYDDNPQASTPVTVQGVTATRVYFYRGTDFQDGVRQLAAAINSAAGHDGGSAREDHLIAVESTFDSTVTDKRHVVQIIPRVNSREEADQYDSGAKSLTIAYYSGIPKWTPTKSPRYEWRGGASLKACGIPMTAHHQQHNWHRRSKDFNRGVIAKASYGTAGVTGSFQTFVQLKEDSVFKYDSLVIPTYEFLSMFDVHVPYTIPGSGFTGNAVLATTGAFLPIFQRCQHVNQHGGIYTGRGNPLGKALDKNVRESVDTLIAANGAGKGYDKNILNLWSRWPFERGDRRSIDALNPTTFRVDLSGSSALKGAQPICRVQVPDMNRLDAIRVNSGSNESTTVKEPYNNHAASVHIPAHYSASLVGFGRANGTYRTAGGLTFDNVHARRAKDISSETEWACYSPRENPDIAKKTLKALFGFETSHYMRWGADNLMHVNLNGNYSLYYRARFRSSYAGGPTAASGKEVGDRPSRAHIVVRGMRYGLDNYIPTEDKVYIRHNTYGQFRDMLEQRKFYVSCGPDGVALPDRPVEVTFVSRREYDDLGNIKSERRRGVDPETTNSQNLSTYVTSSIPYIDDWEVSALENSRWQYGRDRSSLQPDAKESVTSIDIA